MAVKVAINGFGRIGRLAFRLMFGSKDIEVVAVNDLTPAEDLAYYLKYDSAQGGYKHDISSKEVPTGQKDEKGKDITRGFLIVDGKEIEIYKQKDPKLLPWKTLQVDVVIESTGRFTKKVEAAAHLEAGAKKVVISAPSDGDVETIVYNVNHQDIKGDEDIISGASCTTNCLAPVVKVLDEKFGIVSGLMTTVHAYTNDQSLLDLAHPKGFMTRRGRAAAANIVPASTGAASAISQVLPQLKGKLNGMAFRIPTVTGSVVDLVIKPAKKVTVEEVNKALKEAANETLGFTMDPIVSSDVIGTSYGSLVDGLSTQLITTGDEQLLKVVSWYDNEMSYTAQLIRTVKYLASKIK